MLHLVRIIAPAIVATLLIASSALAANTPNEINQRIGSGDPVAGKVKSALCEGCHGIDGNSTAPGFPKLNGQWADYVQKQFRNFQNLARINDTMNEVSQSVSDFQDVFDIAAYFASVKMMTGIPIQSEEERDLYYKGEKLYLDGDDTTGAFRCIMCHGIRGRGEPLNNNLFPVIGGQHKEYLIKQLLEFKSGFRGNDPSGMMIRITSHLSEKDIEALAVYLAREPGIELEQLELIEPVKVMPVKKFALQDKMVRLEGTNFDTGSAVLKPSAFAQLQEVIEFTTAIPEANLTIVGHTDIIGSVESNLALSDARAASVKQYLVEKGVAADRITTEGKGSSQPIAENKTVAGRAKNRRVEIRSVIKEQKEQPSTPPAK